MGKEMDKRDRAALLRHYEIERDLSDRLRCATAEERRALYRTVYDELFQRVPDHPQNVCKGLAADQQASTDLQLALLGHFLRPDSVYLEIGSGDCHLAKAVARRVRQAYAVDVSQVIPEMGVWPENLRLIISDGVRIDVPPGSVHVAYSNQLMEHLHPDDAIHQLREIYNSLAPGGVYVCVTPHGFSGPHDISGYFGSEPRGFHLKEYTHGELNALFRTTGFATVEHRMGLRGRFFRVPGPVALGCEAAMGILPKGLRKDWTRFVPFRSLFLNAIVVGRKPGPAAP